MGYDLQNTSTLSHTKIKTIITLPAFHFLTMVTVTYLVLFMYRVHVMSSYTKSQNSSSFNRQMNRRVSYVARFLIIEASRKSAVSARTSRIFQQTLATNYLNYLRKLLGNLIYFVGTFYPFRVNLTILTKVCFYLVT